MLTRRLDGLLVVLACTATALAVRQTKPDLSGTWIGKGVLSKEGAPAVEEDLRAVLKHSGSELTGTVGPSVEQQLPIANGKVETTEAGTVLSFQWGRGERRVFFEAKLVDATLRGTAKDEYYKATIQIELTRSKQ